MQTRTYACADEAQVIALWERCGLTRPWNDPRRDIARKLGVQPELFRLGTLEDDRVVASVMAGYDGHRGWINYLAVDPAHRRQGIAVRMLREAEAGLLELGCPKVNLQVRATNLEAVAFYRRIGWLPDEVVSFGKRLIDDGPGPGGG